MNKIYTLICLICFFCHFISAQIIPPYYNDFENNATGWYAVSNTGCTWQWDTINTGACSGNMAWDLGLDSSFLPNTTAFLYTPVFDFTSIATATLCFWHKYQTELYQDGTRMEYSIDNGITWTLLGSAGTGPNWYSSFFITAGGNLPGWSGYLSVCQYASKSLDSLGGNATVQFRFVFNSGATVGNGYEHVIDEFAICIGPCTCNGSVGISESYNSENLFNVYPNPANDVITVSQKNNSTSNVTLSNLLGKDILNRKTSEEETVIDVKNITSGIYFISVEQDRIVVRKKIVISH
ncbi:MAG: T9SS type A sorting domain-containing protein [Bacteroidia bacterium]